MIKSSIKVLATLIMSLFLFSTATAGDPVKVGFVYVGPVGDHGWTYRHDIGRQQVEEAFVLGRSVDFERLINEYATGRTLVLAGISARLSGRIRTFIML